MHLPAPRQAHLTQASREWPQSAALRNASEDRRRSAARQNIAVVVPIVDGAGDANGVCMECPRQYHPLKCALLFIIITTLSCDQKVVGPNIYFDRVWSAFIPKLATASMIVFVSLCIQTTTPSRKHFLKLKFSDLQTLRARISRPNSLSFEDLRAGPQAPKWCFTVGLLLKFVARDLACIVSLLTECLCYVVALYAEGLSLSLSLSLSLWRS